jgi:uncharacterized protein (TIGR03435 family)
VIVASGEDYVAKNRTLDTVLMPAVLRRRGLFSCMALLALCGLIVAADQNAPSHPTFEVASIKPASPVAAALPEMAAIRMPGLQEIRDETQDARPPGWLPIGKARITLRRQSLVNLIAAAYRVRRAQVSGPSWMSELRFDIDAKIPEGAPPGSANEMLQSLLEERFGLRLRRENKDLAGYALVVGKGGPTLRVSASDGNPPKDDDVEKEDSEKKREEDRRKTVEDLKNTVANTAMSGGGGTSSHWSRKGATTADLADRLSQVIHKPVVDLTSLKGKYDLDLEIRQTSGDSLEYGASQAIAKLGLRLEQCKVPTVILVVDNIAKTPTSN